jgi:hypothetical protein
MFHINMEYSDEASVPVEMSPFFFMWHDYEVGMSVEVNRILLILKIIHCVVDLKNTVFK